MGSTVPRNAQAQPCFPEQRLQAHRDRTGPPGSLLRVRAIFLFWGPGTIAKLLPDSLLLQALRAWSPVPAKAGAAPQGRPSQVCSAVLSSLPAPTDGRVESPSITAVSGQLPSRCPRQMAPLLPPSPSPTIYHPCQAAGQSRLLSEPCVQNARGGRAERHMETHPSSLRASSLLCTAMPRCQPSCVCVCMSVCTGMCIWVSV